MKKLEMVYLMNVALYFSEYPSFKCFIEVNKKCRNAISSLRFAHWFDNKRNQIFHSCETIRLSSITQLSELTNIESTNIQRITFIDIPELEFIDKKMREFIVNGSGFVRHGIYEFSQLEIFNYKLSYNFFNLENIERDVFQENWNDLLSLPKLKRIIIECSHCSTPFFISEKEIHQFNALLLRLVKILSSHKLVTVEIQIENLDDYCVNEFKKNNQVVISYNGHISKIIINSILNERVVLKKSFGDFTFSIQQLEDKSMNQIVEMYLPITVHLRPFTVVSKYYNPLSPNGFENETSELNCIGSLDLSLLTSIKNMDILLQHSLSFKLPTSVENLVTNAMVENLSELKLLSLDLKTDDCESIFPPTLTFLKITHSPIEKLHSLTCLKMLNCFDCSSLTSIDQSPDLSSLSLMNCNDLKSIELSSNISSVTLLQTGITSITIPTSVTKMVIDTQIMILNEKELTIVNSYETFN